MGQARTRVFDHSHDRAIQLRHQDHSAGAEAAQGRGQGGEVGGSQAHCQGPPRWSARAGSNLHQARPAAVHQDRHSHEGVHRRAEAASGQRAWVLRRQGGGSDRARAQEADLRSLLLLRQAAHRCCLSRTGAQGRAEVQREGSGGEGAENGSGRSVQERLAKPEVRSQGLRQAGPQERRSRSRLGFHLRGISETSLPRDRLSERSQECHSLPQAVRGHRVDQSARGLQRVHHPPRDHHGVRPLRQDL
mmetsp:Transcript_8815/g.20050  ORF Transcript_8815/g.20050 Transcript_8815/m.20050 type:complete len:247 (-) Transcript_8815:758-1498(-)